MFQKFILFKVLTDNFNIAIIISAIKRLSSCFVKSQRAGGTVRTSQAELDELHRN